MFLSRRHLLSAAAVPLLGGLERSQAEDRPARRLKVVMTGGHPGDPECGCAGTIARYADLGHEVALLYLNRGEGFCGRSDTSQCASVRTAEALEACRILKARAAFAGQMDGNSVVDNDHYGEFRRLIDTEKPDVIFTQWPIDSHRDHRALSTLVLDAWLAGGRKSALYFYEVTDDTMMFTPTEFVDIWPVEARRRAACYAHASQDPDKWYPGQKKLTALRGQQSGYREAEAFARHWESRGNWLP